MQVLLGPHVSEKATALAEGSNQVVFKVRSDATKADIRQAVELLFEVKVERVTVVRMPAKTEALRHSAPARARRGRRPTCGSRRGSDINFMGAE